MRLRSLLSLGLLTAAVLWVATAEAQPGPRGGSDTARLQAEIQKLKAALAEAEARLEKSKKAPADSDKLVEELKKLLDAKKKGPESDKAGRGFDKAGWGGFGKGWGWEKGGFGKGPFGKEGADKGKAAPSESDKLIQALKELLEKQAGPGKGEATKASSIEHRLDALQKSLDEIRREIRKR